MLIVWGVWTKQMCKSRFLGTEGVRIYVLRSTMTTPFFTLQCIQTHLPPTADQPLDFKSPMPSVTVAPVSNQRCQLTRKPFYLSETDRPNPSS